VPRTHHRCFNFRHGSAGVYRWEFDKGNQSLAVAVQGPLIVDDVELLIRAAIDGVGLAFMLEDRGLEPDKSAPIDDRDVALVCRPKPGLGVSKGQEKGKVR
jgi:DNA-binding transcriptional LysR family regulator